jgi:TolA-binding protein
MRRLRPVLALLVGLPLVALGASREIVELQRDVSFLREEMRNLQKTLDQKVANLTSLLEQALERLGQVNTSVVQLDGGVAQKLESQERVLVAPVAGLSTKMEQMNAEFGYVRESVQDLSGRIGKLEAQLVDMKAAFTTMSAPPPPPTGATSSLGGPGDPQASQQPPPGVSAKTLYDNAMRDKSSGRLELAEQQFRDYLAWFPNTELAANAQFYLGEIAFNRDNQPAAIEHFDVVLERYPENNKTEDAFYMKGVALIKMGERTRGAEEFYELLRRYPDGRLAPKAKAQLRALGLTTVPPKKASSL